MPAGGNVAQPPRASLSWFCSLPTKGSATNGSVGSFRIEKDRFSLNSKSSGPLPTVHRLSVMLEAGDPDGRQPIDQSCCRTGRVRTRRCPCPIVTTAPDSRSDATASTLAGIKFACWSGVSRSADRRRTSDGSLRPPTARRVAKSASAEMTIRPLLDAWARIDRSSAVSRPSSLTWVTSCPAQRTRAATRGERFASTRNLKPAGPRAARAPA
jgi:hypothetical protein